MPALTSDRDKVRLKIGDTDSADALLSDDEVDTCLAEHGDLNRAAAAAAEAIAAQFSRQFDFQTDGQAFRRSQKAAAYRALAKELRAKAGIQTQATTRTDGYSDDVDYQDVAASSSGRVRAGYTDPDLPV